MSVGNTSHHSNSQHGNRDLTRTDSFASTTSTFSTSSSVSNHSVWSEPASTPKPLSENVNVLNRSLSARHTHTVTAVPVGARGLGNSRSLSRRVFTGVKLQKLKRSYRRSRTICSNTTITMDVVGESTARFPYRISSLSGQGDASDWVMSGPTEAGSQRWVRAIEHNRAVLSRRQSEEREAQVRINRHGESQWNNAYTAQAQMALFNVLEKARGGGGKATAVDETVGGEVLGKGRNQAILHNNL